VKYIFLIFFSFYGLFFNNGLKAAEKINIKFEEMEIPLTIEQLSKLEKYKDDSTELIDWLKKNGFIRVFELSKFLEFPVFKEEGFNREILRSWIGRKILTELSKNIKVPNDNNGTEIYNTIENLLDQKKEVSTLEIIKALPSEEISLDIDNLILIISSWKNELSMQQELLSKLNNLERTNQNAFKNTEKKSTQDLTKIDKKIYGPIIIQDKTYEDIQGRKVLKVLNQENKKLFLSINCDKNELDVRIPGRKWMGSKPAKEEFENNLINDFC